MDEERRERFDTDLAAPLPGRETERPVAAIEEAEGAAFLAVMAQHQQVAGRRG